MANINDAFPSKYIKATDLKGTEPVVAIDRVEYEAVGREKDRKAVVYFQGKEKGLVLNKTNAMKIVQLSGSGDTDDWNGFRIKIYATETEFAGETVECIRIKAAGNGKAMAAKALPEAPPKLPPMKVANDDTHSEPLDEDSIPF